MAFARPVRAHQPTPMRLVDGADRKPTVTVVTPTLNPGGRLARCLASVAGQSYPRVEHIVVDGGSTDGTVELLASAQAVSHVCRPGSGQAEAINAGFAFGSGSILTWLNADDVLLPTAVERAVGALSLGGSLSLVYGNCRIVRDGHELLTWRPPRRFDFAALESGSWIPQPGSFLRRSTFERVGGLDESFDLAMDLDLWLRLLGAGVRSRRLDGLVSVFELHPTSKTGSTPRRSFHEENARAFLLAGRPRGAAISLGRAAATAAAESHGALDPHLASAHEAGRRAAPPLPARTITAAARAEAAVIELGSSLRGVRHLACAAVWLDPLVRRRLSAALRRGGPRVARRLLRLDL